jgi:hypothetical protein
MLPARLPSGVRVRFDETSKIRSIVLEKPQFFTATIRVESVMGGSPGAVLPNLSVSRVDRQTWQTFLFRVTCTAEFARWTAGNARTAEYKEWVHWLFAEIQRQFADQ